MINYLEYLSEYINVPTKITIAIIVLFIAMQVVGEVMEFCGKVAPRFMKIRKMLAERKANSERQNKEVMDMLKSSNEMLKETRTFLAEVKAHYSEDNIAKRNEWMDMVDKDRSLIHTLEPVLAKLSDDVLKLRIESMHSDIINFASKVVDDGCPVTREQYRRIFRLYDEYEKLLEENGMENGEINTNYYIIKQSYEKRLKTHSFIEDANGLYQP